MREILFRGKRVDNGDWVYGVPTKDLKGQMVIVESVFECAEYNCLGANCLYVDENSIGQFTGLTDKNGKKIFEGDIVEFTDRYTGSKGIAEIVFEAYKWEYSGYYYGENPMVWICIADRGVEFEIIGNIHDNPELLEENK